MSKSWKTTTIMIKLYSSVGKQRTITSHYKIHLIRLSCFLLYHPIPCQMSFFFFKCLKKTWMLASLNECITKNGHLLTQHIWSLCPLLIGEKKFFTISTYMAHDDCDHSKCILMLFKSVTNNFALKRSKTPLPLWKCLTKFLRPL